jgi:transposase
MTKTRELTEFERGVIIGLKKSKKSIREIEKITGYSRNAIFNIINNYEKKGLTKPMSRSGRPHKLSQKNKQ